MSSRSIFVAFAVFSAVIIAVSGNVQPPNGCTKPIETMTVNLDEPALTRWNPIMERYKAGVNFVIEHVIHSLPLTPEEVKLATELLGDLDTHLGAPYADEIRGVAAAVGLEDSVGDIVLMNLFYELTAACTSVVATNSSGAVFHGRNLDYGIDGLRNITVQVDFQSGGETVYTGVTYAGYVGLLTGMRRGAFSVSVDERDTVNGSIWQNALEALLEDGQSIGFFLRDMLQEHTQYKDALAVITQQHLVAPVYIIVGGADSDGAIVTRDRQKAADVWPLDPANGGWFRVETNYDHWKPAPAGDDRRDPANRRMNATTAADVTLEYIRDKVLYQPPNLNAETTYTAWFSATTGEFGSIVQNC